MISTNNGMRTTGTSERRIIEMIELVTTSTAVVATPRAKPFTAGVVIASSGQRPKGWRRAGLLVERPSCSVFLSSSMKFRGCRSLVGLRGDPCGRREQLVAVTLEV